MPSPAREINYTFYYIFAFGFLQILLQVCFGCIISNKWEGSLNSREGEGVKFQKLTAESGIVGRLETIMEISWNLGCICMILTKLPSILLTFFLQNNWRG